MGLSNADERRTALVELADQMFAELHATKSTRDRLPLARALMACLRDIEAMDEADRRQARHEARTVATDAEVSAVDDLLSARKARYANRVS